MHQNVIFGFANMALDITHSFCCYTSSTHCHLGSNPLSL